MPKGKMPLWKYIMRHNKKFDHPIMLTVAWGGYKACKTCQLNRDSGYMRERRKDANRVRHDNDLRNARRKKFGRKE